MGHPGTNPVYLPWQDSYRDQGPPPVMSRLVAGRAAAMEKSDPFVCLDCGKGKALEDMATECPDLKHADTGQRTGSCKECHA